MRRQGHSHGTPAVGTALGPLAAVTAFSAAVAVAAAAGAASSLAPLLAHDWSSGAPTSTATLEAVVATAVLVLGGGFAVRYGLAAGLGVALAVAAHRGRRLPRAEVAVRAWAPPVVRRAVALALGSTLGLGLTAAPAGASPHVPDDLRWSAATAVAPTGAASTVTVVDHPPPAPSEPVPSLLLAATEVPTGPASASRSHHEVRAGESLWTIAAASLEAGGHQATAAAVATEWPRWYAANAALIGPDPGLIRPGQLFTAPEEGPQS